MNKQEAIDFVKKNGLCVLSTCAGKIPESATVMYIFYGEKFYIGTSKDSRKMKNLKKNENIAIVVGVSGEQASVQIQGKARILTGEEDKKARKLYTDAGYSKYADDPNNVYIEIVVTEFWCNGERL